MVCVGQDTAYQLNIQFIDGIEKYYGNAFANRTLIEQKLDAIQVAGFTVEQQQMIHQRLESLHKTVEKSSPIQGDFFKISIQQKIVEVTTKVAQAWVKEHQKDTEDGPIVILTFEDWIIEMDRALTELKVGKGNFIRYGSSLGAIDNGRFIGIYNAKTVVKKLEDVFEQTNKAQHPAFYDRLELLIKNLKSKYQYIVS